MAVMLFSVQKSRIRKAEYEGAFVPQSLASGKLCSNTAHVQFFSKVSWHDPNSTLHYSAISRMVKRRFDRARVLTWST